MTRLSLPAVCLFLALFMPALAKAANAPASWVFTVGNVRVETLSPTLVRIELKGAEGFEDRATFFIVKRDWPGDPGTSAAADTVVQIKTADYTVSVPSNATSLAGITVSDSAGNVLYTVGKLPGSRVALPGPTDNLDTWAIQDSPRMIPPAWGYNPAPAGSANASTNGWDMGNDSPDLYVFLPKNSLHQLRTDFTALTGPTQLVPLHALGAWDSRYFEYTDKTALQQIKDYQSHHIPLDNLVIDTDWRNGGSTGYDINPHDFPNMKGFIAKAHSNGLWVVFNDHPQPVAPALDSKEVANRNVGTRSILADGLDVWWYDRNWRVALAHPDGIDTNPWGMYVYNWIMSDFYPNRRPMIMANVDGLQPEISSHRYDIQWTGDIQTGFPSLKAQIVNAVNEGIVADFPYTSSDLGGHVADPTPENYARWIEYGALSPILRPHCTKGLPAHGRMPWLFGPSSEAIARDYYNMRYRLLPYLYQLARNNYDTSDPLLKRCDLVYPKYAEAATADQYLLGDRVLVAPIYTSAGFSAVPDTWLKTATGDPGLVGSYFSNDSLSGAPALTRTDPQIDFSWNSGSPAPKVPSAHFSVRWTGTITIPGTNPGMLGVTSDDGVRLFIDGVKVIDDWGPADSTYVESPAISPGSHSVTLEYQQIAGNDLCHLSWRPGSLTTVQVTRSVWIPPGTWIDAWSGTAFTGPQTITASADLRTTPIYVEAGTIVPLAPQMSHTGELPWDPLALDVYPAGDDSMSAVLYEDDTVSSAYKTGAFRTTEITGAANSGAHTVTVQIMPAQGTFTGAKSKRGWLVRIHKPAGFAAGKVASVTVDAGKAKWGMVPQDTAQMPFEHDGAATDSDVTVVTVPSSDVSKARTVVVTYAGG